MGPLSIYTWMFYSMRPSHDRMSTEREYAEMNRVCLLVASLVGLSSLAVFEEEIPQLVHRRIGDIIRFNKRIEQVCNYNSTLTFLVNERRCVNDEELFDDCNFAITASEEPSDYRIILSITYQNHTDAEVVTAVTINSQSSVTDAVVVYDGQPINSSFCYIASLEVYRGRKQAIDIEHDGFSLSDRGTIEINCPILSYGIEEYVGELYRMNLSCSGGGLPESGCLFFKVAGTTNITNAKFNCTVPGNFNEECNIPTTSGISGTTSPTTMLNITTVATLSPNSSSGFVLGGTYLLIVVICGVLAVILLVSMVLVCFIVCLLRRKVRSSSAVEQTTVGEGTWLQQIPSPQEETLPPTVYHNNPAYIHLDPMKSPQVAASQNPAYIARHDAEHGVPVASTNCNQETTYDVIQDGSSHTTAQGMPRHFSQNPAYSHLAVSVQEIGVQTDPTPPCQCDCSQNPANGVHSSPN